MSDILGLFHRSGSRRYFESRTFWKACWLKLSKNNLTLRAYLRNQHCVRRNLSVRIQRHCAKWTLRGVAITLRQCCQLSCPDCPQCAGQRPIALSADSLDVRGMLHERATTQNSESVKLALWTPKLEVDPLYQTHWGFRASHQWILSMTLPTSSMKL